MAKFSAKAFIVMLSFESSCNICLRLGSAMTWKTSGVCVVIGQWCLTVLPFYLCRCSSPFHDRQHPPKRQSRHVPIAAPFPPFLGLASTPLSNDKPYCL